MRLFTALFTASLVIAATPVAAQDNLAFTAGPNHHIDAQKLDEARAAAEAACEKQLAPQAGEMSPIEYIGATNQCADLIVTMKYPALGTTVVTIDHALTPEDSAPATLRACEHYLTRQGVARMSDDYGTTVMKCIARYGSNAHFVAEYLPQREALDDAMRVCTLYENGRMRSYEKSLTKYFGIHNTGPYAAYAGLTDASDCLGVELIGH